MICITGFLLCIMSSLIDLYCYYKIIMSSKPKIKGFIILQYCWPMHLNSLYLYYLMAVHFIFSVWIVYWSQLEYVYIHLTLLLTGQCITKENNKKLSKTSNSNKYSNKCSTNKISYTPFVDHKSPTFLLSFLSNINYLYYISNEYNIYTFGN